jgi:uncharacterized membrane protein YecN with MAPEG domain
MNKKAYQKPTMQIVKLRQQTRLLTGSDPVGVTAGRTSYGTATEYTWEDVE